MRQILVEHARKRGAEKRGAGVQPTEFDETRVAFDRPAELVALDELVKFDERKARVTELHYFGGRCARSTSTPFARDLRISEAWLRSRLRGER